MPTDGSGVYSLPAGYLATTGQPILASQHNPPLEDIQDALSARLMRNGSNAPTANVPMGTFRFTGLGDGVADTDSAAFGQVGLVWLASQTFNAEATVDFTTLFSSEFRNYLFVGNSIFLSGASTIALRASINAGSSFPAGASDYAYQHVYADATSPAAIAAEGSAATTSILVARHNGGASAGLNFEVELFNASSTSFFKSLRLGAFGVNATGGLRVSNGAGYIAFASSHSSDIDGIRFLPGAGTMSGTITMFGVR